MVYCLSVGLIPEGHGPDGYKDISGLAVRTENPRRAKGWIEHWRQEARPDVLTTVAVELRGKQARVEIDGEVEEYSLVCRPDQLVVGAWKFSQPGAKASATGEHLIRRVRILRI